MEANSILVGVEKAYKLHTCLPNAVEDMRESSHNIFTARGRPVSGYLMLFGGLTPVCFQSPHILWSCIVGGAVNKGALSVH